MTREVERVDRPAIGTVSLFASTVVGTAAGLIHPALGVLVAATGGTTFGSVATGAAAGAIALLAATLIKLGIGTVLNPVFLVMLIVGIGVGLALRARLEAESDPDVE